MASCSQCSYQSKHVLCRQDRCLNTVQLKIQNGLLLKLYTTLSHVPEAPNLIQTYCFKQVFCFGLYQNANLNATKSKQM